MEIKLYYSQSHVMKQNHFSSSKLHNCVHTILGQTDKKTNPLNILQSGTFHFKRQSAGNEREKKRKGKKFDLTHDESSKPAGNICKSFCFQLFKQCLKAGVSEEILNCLSHSLSLSAVLYFSVTCLPQSAQSIKMDANVSTKTKAIGGGMLRF